MTEDQLKLFPYVGEDDEAPKEPSPSLAAPKKTDCAFCSIVAGDSKGRMVFRNEHSLAFLDKKPLFLGHCLVVPLEHYETISDLPEELVGNLFSSVQLVARAVQSAMECEGIFVAINNTVSQSVPHLHVHVVPRRMQDGLKGFFWPRHAYSSESEVEQVREKIRSAIRMLSVK